MIPISTDAPLYHYPIATVSVMVLNVLMFLAVGLNPGVEEIEIDGSRTQVSEPSGPDEIDRGKGWDQVLKEEEPNGNEVNEPGFDQFEEEWAREQAGQNRVRRQTGFLHRNLCLEFGTFKPWQWVTNNFMHDGWIHLIGNLVFLWAFGIVVEGKVGWLVFSAIYLAVGAIYGFILQMGTVIVGMDEGMALGASAAIFGLLAICVAWAPANEFETIWFFGFYGGLTEISILTFGAFFFVKEFVFLGLQGFRMSSELLHIMGFLIALPVGLWMVKAGHVNCEGWDVFSYLQGRTGQDSKILKQTERIKKEKRKRQKEESQAMTAPSQQNLTQLQSQVAEALDRGEFELAHRLHLRIASNNSSIQWQQSELHRIISGYLKAKRYTEASSLIQTYVEMFEQDRFAMQVALMRIWLGEQKPRKVLKYVKGMNVAFLGPEQTAKLKPIVEHAKKMIEAGVIEIQND
ncbi:MAG: rhomboid family intramembrane serine protease [Pirellula sp.]|jgi:membrane associated rhomboid family serine protease|nr:rhomboid family intramembrane serine protease [Pirellula sp.]